MRRIIFLFLCLLLIGCSSNFHLKKFLSKGGKIDRDTVYQDLVIPPSTTSKTDSIPYPVFKEKIFHDTLIINNTKWRTKTIYDTVTNTVYQQVEIKQDTLKNVPTTINNTYKPKDNSMWIYILCGLVGLFILILIFKK